MTQTPTHSRLLRSVEDLAARSRPMDFARLSGAIFSDLAFPDPSSWCPANRMGSLIRQELLDTTNTAKPPTLTPHYAKVLSSLPFHTRIEDPHLLFTILCRIAALSCFTNTFR